APLSEGTLPRLAPVLPRHTRAAHAAVPRDAPGEPQHRLGRGAPRLPGERRRPGGRLRQPAAPALGRHAGRRDSPAQGLGAGARALEAGGAQAGGRARRFAGHRVVPERHPVGGVGAMSTLGRVIGYFRPYWRRCALVALGVLASSLLGLVGPLLLRRIIDGA